MTLLGLEREQVAQDKLVSKSVEMFNAYQITEESSATNINLSFKQLNNLIQNELI